MESLEVMKIKIKGIIGCIHEYTGEPFINNIMNECEKAIQDNNLEILIFSCTEISKWYDQNIRKIERNDFVFDKEIHHNNLKLIKEITKNLELYMAENNNPVIVNDNKKTSNTDKDTIIKLLNRFHFVAKQLRDRYNNRETLDIADEYDVQDLLHSLLYIYCDDIRAEEWCPSYAGQCSRQDFLLKKEKIIIETKKTRKGLNAKELSNELILDIARYKSHPDCNTLICFVYDPEERIINPRGIESDLTKNTDGIDVIVLIKP